MNKFWKKVHKCNHVNLYPDYRAIIYCSTPYCTGSEYHCKDCGVYVSDCMCGANYYLSGWPHSKWKNRYMI